MKKTSVLIMLLAFASVTFTSCRKEYECTCTRTDSSGGQRTDVTTISASKKNAQKECEESVPDSDYGKVCTTGRFFLKFLSVSLFLSVLMVKNLNSSCT
jgi:hypothetical protein